MNVLRRVAVNALLVGALIAMAAVLGASRASAHTDLVGSDPEPGASRADAVSAVTLTFNASVLPELTEIVVRDPRGKNHATGEPAVLGSRVSVPVTGLATPGSYHVAYRVVAADGHPITGTYSFHVSAKAARDASVTRASAADLGGVDSSTGGSTPWLFPGLGMLAVALVVSARVRVAVRGGAR